jgi:preprotein translocase subunit YajC
MSGALLLPIYIVLILGVLWFVAIRPQQRRRRELTSLIDRLQPGDEVVTIAGVYGTVTEVEDGDTVLLEVAEDVDIRVAKASIARLATQPSEAVEAPASESPSAESPTGASS